MLEKERLIELCRPPAANKAYFRPFICRGNPSDINIFLVGINPSTPIFSTDMDPEEYVDLICDYSKFIVYYKETRSKAGKTELSKTRKAIDAFMEWLHSKTNASVAETNIISYPTEKAKHLKLEDTSVLEHGKEIFGDLLIYYKPQILITHGKYTIEAILTLLEDKGLELDKTDLTNLRKMDYTHISQLPSFKYPDGSNCSIIAYKHFIYYGPNGQDAIRFQSALEKLLNKCGLLLDSTKE